MAAEFRDELPEGVVVAYLQRAVAAVAFFGDDPAEHADWVEGIARNELMLLSGRDTDRART